MPAPNVEVPLTRSVLEPDIVEVVAKAPSIVRAAKVVAPSAFSVLLKFAVVPTTAAKEPAATAAAPMTVPSIEPPLRSIVVTVPMSAQVMPATVQVLSPLMVRAFEAAAVPRVVMSR